MKADLFFHTLNEIDDKYVEEVTECIGKENKKTVHRYRRILGTAAILALICILSSAFPSMARKIPFIGNVFEYLQTQLDFPGPFDKIATSAEMTVRNSGITVTIQELYCDGENLFVSYLIESDKVFSEYTSERYLETQLDFSGENYIQADGEILETDPFGATGLEGQFVDEHTFAGADVVRLVDRQFPDEFIFTLEVHSWNLLVNRGEKEIWGSWKLSVPVRVNHENVETIEVNRTENRHSIDKVTVSPIAITVYTSYPEIYTGTVNYNVIVFSDKSDERIDFQGRYGAVEGKTWIPRDMAGDVLDIYVVDMSTFTLTGIEAFEKSEIEKHAIVSAHVELPQSVEDNLHWREKNLLVKYRRVPRKPGTLRILPGHPVQKEKVDLKPLSYLLRAGRLKAEDRLAAAAVSAEEAAISAAAAAAAQQKDDPQAAVVAAAAVSAEPAAVSAAAGRQQEKPDQGIAAAVVSIVGAATSAVCSS